MIVHCGITEEPCFTALTFKPLSVILAVETPAGYHVTGGSKSWVHIAIALTGDAQSNLL